MFDKKDEEIDRDFEEIQKLWDKNRYQNEKLKRIKENFNDIDYFADNA